MNLEGISTHEELQIRLIDDVLDGHVGEKNAISWSTLLLIMIGEGYEINKNDLRGMIRVMRRNGSLICSSQNGYYRPTTLKEALAFSLRLREPAKDMMVTARIQRQAAQRFFGGQIPMPK